MRAAVPPSRPPAPTSSCRPACATPTARTRSRRPSASCWRRSSSRPRTGGSCSRCGRRPGITAERHVFFLARGLTRRRPRRLRPRARGGCDGDAVGARRRPRRGRARRPGHRGADRGGRACLRRPAPPGPDCEGLRPGPAAGPSRRRRAQRPALGAPSPAQLRLRRGRHRRATGRPGPHRPAAAARGWGRRAVLVGLRALDDGPRGGRRDPRAGGRGVPDDRAVRRPDGVGDHGRRGRGGVGVRAGGLAAGRGGWPPDRRVARGAADVPPARACAT